MKRAAIICMLDMSGSISDDMQAVARAEVMALEAYVQGRGPGFAARFVLFDAFAREVSRDEFFAPPPVAGGTMISAALKRAADIVEADYAPAEWDAFVVTFTDGDNWSLQDTLSCMDLLRERLLPQIAAFGLAQFESPYGNGAFVTEVQERFAAEPRVVSAILTTAAGFASAFVERVQSLGTPAAKKTARKKSDAPSKKRRGR